jgi:predicted amino acid dehydrogenase
MDEDEFDDNKNAVPPTGFLYSRLDLPNENAVKVTFIGHFVYPTHELRMLERDFCRASDTGLRLLFNHMQVLLEMNPVTLFRKNMFNDRIFFSFIVLPLDSAELERLHRQNKKYKIVEKIQKAVDMAAREGARYISLGGYTSILTNNGMSVVAPAGSSIITGNTLTAASGIRRIEEEMHHREAFQKDNALAIIGASGNIGTILTEHFVQQKEYFDHIILFCRKKENKQQLHQLLDEIDIDWQHYIDISTDLFRLRECNIIIITTNTSDPIIFPHHLDSQKPILIADNSVPPAICEEIKSMPNVRVLPLASYVKLPDDPDFIISAYTPPGTSFCCAAEAMLCGLADVNLPLRGKITKSCVDAMSRLAERYGFFEKLGAIESYKV